jgi:small conductance mechanosensitive channel
MDNEMNRLERIGETLSQHGTEMVLALGILILGLLAARWIDKGLRILMKRLLPTSPNVTAICNAVYIVMVIIVVMIAAVEFGANPTNMLRLLTILALIAVGLIIFLRPFIPAMPFKVGNTVRAADLLGKVEAVTFLNTRLRTFDGKTFFVPNRKILDDVVINYHFYGTRRIKINVNIRYDQDLLHAKRTLEAVMIGDPRVKPKPAPVVYVLNLASNCVEIGGRCWVDKKVFWVARCDLNEKIKLRFDHEGIRFAFPQLDLHLDPDGKGGKTASAIGLPNTAESCDRIDEDEEII